MILLDLFLTAMIVVGISTSTARFWGILFTMFLAMVYIAVVIGGGEYHYRRIGQPSSWKVFSFTIVGQLFILILPFLL